MENNQLQPFLEEVIIPTFKKKPKTFLSIAKQPHYENVISNMYAFFFNVHEEHGLKDLFIRSLIECINEKNLEGKDFSNFVDFTIETEYSTRGIGKKKKKGRIDLLLRSNEQAILIENKIYHHLDNDLDDYWHSVRLASESNSAKIGIILSLKSISEDLYQQYETKKEYINLTHFHLMQKVIGNSENYTKDNESKHVHFLHDFNQNIMNLSNPTMKSEDINFYLENQEKVNQLVLFKQQFKNHIVSEVNKAGESINGVKLIVPKHKFNSRRLRYYRSTNHSELLYTIIYGDLFKDGSSVEIIIEPRGNTLKNGVQFQNIDFDEKEKAIIRKDFYTKTNEQYAHFASRFYPLKTEDIADLSGFIQSKIVQDRFASVFEKLEKFLTSRR